MSWEMVIGLETHVELGTKSKIFCSCTTEFGGDPNTHCCPVCTGQPGSLPVLNRQAVEYAVLAGLAVNCNISRMSKMDRKHYVYPDLPKAYQISQYDLPLCLGGYVELDSGKKINITRIHIEEDAGKLIHERGEVYVDYNRGGVPLIEIVTEPDIRSAAEAVEYLEKLQSIMRSIGVSDCRMQEGSLRCDVNISLRRNSSEPFGTRTEVKNLNSFTAIEAAINFEYDRQESILESGGKVIQQTLHFDPQTGETYDMRGKENADDYRYFPEPDIIPICLTDEYIEALRTSLPELPEQKLRRYTQELGLSDTDARLLTKYRRVSEYFEAGAEISPKTSASFILMQIFKKISTEAQREEWKIAFSAEDFRELVSLTESGKINRNIAKRILDKMLDTGRKPSDLMSEENVSGLSDDELLALCRKTAEAAPQIVQDYRGGKSKALQALIGSVMRETRGRADAKKTEEFFISIISEYHMPKKG